MRALILALIIAAITWVLLVMTLTWDRHLLRVERARREAVQDTLDKVCSAVEGANKASADLTDRFVGEQIRKIVQPALEKCRN